jgi:hypothetical protein
MSLNCGDGFGRSTSSSLGILRLNNQEDKLVHSSARTLG